jgi:phenylpropionate dioxygenase-like ring-hydroxylating dioxygenase large terminal subunit
MNLIAEKSTSPCSFVYNTWYCAAWSEEVSGQPLARKMLNDPIVLFRDSAGDAKAVRDMCPHKLAPLSLGKVCGDHIQCPYHGLQFDGTGRCVHNPFGAIPRLAQVRSYPLVERDTILWIWLGDPSAADPARIPDCSYITSPQRRTVRSKFTVAANWRLPLDNLMDLGHVPFVHGASSGFTPRPMEVEVSEEGNTVTDRRFSAASTGINFFAKELGAVDGLYDNWLDTKWSPAGIVQNHTGLSRLGCGRNTETGDQADFADNRGTHLLTPETETSTHYFPANSRNYRLTDTTVDDFFKAWQQKALKGEDSAMTEAIQRAAPDAERLGIKPMPFLSTDASGVRVARIIDRLIAEEARNEGTVSSSRKSVPA